MICRFNECSFSYITQSQSTILKKKTINQSQNGVLILLSIYKLLSPFSLEQIVGFLRVT